MEGVEMPTVPAGYFDSNPYLASTRFLLFLIKKVVLATGWREWRERERERGRETDTQPTSYLCYTDGPCAQALCPLSGLPGHIKGGGGSR